MVESVQRLCKKEECWDYKDYKDYKNGDKIRFFVKKVWLNGPLISDSFFLGGFSFPPNRRHVFHLMT